MNPQIQNLVPAKNPKVTHTVVFTAKETSEYEPFRDREGDTHEGFNTAQKRPREECEDGTTIVTKQDLIEILCAFSMRHNDVSIDMIRECVKPESFPLSSKATYRSFDTISHTDST